MASRRITCDVLSPLCPFCRLKVTVSHADPSTGVNKDVQKYYRFAVVEPFTFNYRTPFLQHDAPKLFVEVDLGNSTPSPVTLSSVRFDPSPGYSATLVTPLEVHGDVPGDGIGSAVFDPLDVDGIIQAKPYLLSSDAYQLLYEVTPKAGVSSSPLTHCVSLMFPIFRIVLLQQWPSQIAADVGRLSVVYRQQLGEQGVWNSQPLIAKVPTPSFAEPHACFSHSRLCVSFQTPLLPTLTCTWDSIPETVPVDTVATAVFRIRNNSPDEYPPVRLQFNALPDSGVAVRGLSSQVRSLLALSDQPFLCCLLSRS